jgi:HSP20 family molecular chaperone IbpA
MAIKRKRSVYDIIDDYFADLERWAEQFGETLMEKPSWNLKNCTIEPLREVTITPTEVVVTVDLPYTKEGTIKIKEVDSGSIEISAEMKRKVRLDELGIAHCRGEFHKFHCHMHIPVPIDMKKMKTHFKRGMLEIHLPRNR